MEGIVVGAFDICCKLLALRADTCLCHRTAVQGDERTSEAEILRYWLCVQISKKLACGDVGNGALAEPSAIAEAVRGAIFPQKSRLQENTLSIPVVNEH